jgi:hypothetical protein
MPRDWSNQQTYAVNCGMRDHVKDQISSPEIKQSDQNADHRHRRQISEPNDGQVCQDKQRDGDDRSGSLVAPNRRQSLDSITAV